MKENPRSILIVEIAERAKAMSDVKENLIGWYATLEVSTRQFEVIEVNDFAAWRDGAIIISGRGREPGGRQVVQVWWLDPRCPSCGRNNILSQLSDQEFEISCCGVSRQGGIRNISLYWMGYIQKVQSGFYLETNPDFPMPEKVAKFARRTFPG